MPTRLDPSAADRLRSAPFTYPEVGATGGALPSGYHHVRQAAVIGRGTATWTEAAEAVSRWALQQRAGLHPAVSDLQVVVGAVAVLHLGVGRISLPVPVRVVDVVDAAGRRGFAYGTLPGHPERGEESFVVVLDADETVRLEVAAFSRPGTWFTRAAGPAGRLAQSWMTRRYLAALRSEATG